MDDRHDLWQSLISTPTASGTVPIAKDRVVELYHEIGPQPENRTLEEIIEVDELPRHTRVFVKSHVVAASARGFTSPQYLASIRRRESARIADSVSKLKEYQASEDFVVWTHEPLDRLRRLIQKLTDAEQFAEPEHEGNSCEILRQLRDTFLNEGWNRYREGDVRGLVVSILGHLAVADEVSADDADKTMDRLFDIGLNPSVGIIWQHDEEKVSH